jgi:oxygen-independent coproporphyrinogen III oxidase
MYSLYVSIPFCRARCAYCDFNSHAGIEGLMPAYARAVAQEIRAVGATGPVEAHTVFFGGGTPSLLPLPELELILEAMREACTLLPDAEISLEANPGTVDAAYLLGARRLGINRLSLGVQSLNAADLKMLGRIHTVEQAVEAVALARGAGFENLNLDLMMGLPRQTLASWQTTLTQALALRPDHLSAYMLSLEEGTRLYEAVASGRLPNPDADLTADMYEWTIDALEAEGFRQYEISNWAKDNRSGKQDARRREEAEANQGARLPAFACRHNLTYWRNTPYLGFGAGAHGCAVGWRYSNVLTPQAFMARLEAGGTAVFPFSSALDEKIELTAEDVMNETMMLGLRLVGEGVASETFERRFGVSLEQKYGPALSRLAAQGLVEWPRERARLTRAGRLLGNVVFREFV